MLIFIPKKIVKNQRKTDKKKDINIKKKNNNLIMEMNELQITKLYFACIEGAIELVKNLVFKENFSIYTSLDSSGGVSNM